jgi:peptidyl-prolyl cis-trans isomerase A (cyclophilin A)
MKFRSATICLTLALAVSAPHLLDAQATKTPAQSSTTKPPAQGSKPAPAQGTKPAPAQGSKPAPPQGTKPAPAPGAKPAPGRGTAAGASAALTPAAKARLRKPDLLKEVAPATYSAQFDTTVGPFVVQVHRAWAPKGADRFYNLVKNGFFNDARFFRVLPNFMVQFGINGDPSIQTAWRDANITDDPVTQSNKRGYVTFATAGPGTRTTQVFVNFKNNAGLDAQGFAPFGEVTSGMEVVDKINAEYRENPDQGRIQMQGNAYLTRAFPRLDYVKRATIVK